MAKSKWRQEIESMRLENETLRAELKQKAEELDLRTWDTAELKAENAELKQRVAKVEYLERRWSQADAEISRCHKLLDMVPFAPADSDSSEYSHGDLSVRLMGTLLAVGKGKNEKSSDA